MMFQSFYPVIITDKLGEARQFYEQHFGFQAVFATDWYVQLHASRAGGAPPLELALMAPDLDTQPQVLHPTFNGSGIILTFDAEDIDAVFQRLSEVNALSDIVVYPKDEPWGQRHFIFRDVAGVLVDVVQPVTAPAVDG